MVQGQRVKVINAYRDDPPNITGTIAGMGHVTVDSKHTVPIYLVKLDEGFWSHENRVWNAHLPVHRNNLVPID